MLVYGVLLAAYMLVLTQMALKDATGHTQRGDVPGTGGLAPVQELSEDRP
jgi:hypothetical protein